MPHIKDVLNKLPPPLLSILKVNLSSFNYKPESQELQFNGLIDNVVEIVPQFVSLINVKASLTVVIGSEIYVQQLAFTGNWVLHTLPIFTTVSYNRDENGLDITGELESKINIKELLTSLSGQLLPIPSTTASLVTLTKLSGNKIGDTTLIILSDVAGSVEVYIVYQTSLSQSSIETKK